jgi:hypothetical protein
MSITRENQKAQHRGKIGIFLLAVLLSQPFVSLMIGLIFVLVVFVSIIVNSANIFTNLMILLGGILTHLGVFGFLFFFLTDRQFETIACIVQFIPDYIFVYILAKRGLLFDV